MASTLISPNLRGEEHKPHCPTNLAKTCILFTFIFSYYIFKKTIINNDQNDVRIISP